MAVAGASYTTTVSTSASAEEAAQAFLSGLSGAADCSVTMAGPHTIVVTRRYTPTWAVVVGILGLLLFLVGLLAFLVKETETLTITISEGDDATRVNVSGIASPQTAARLSAVMTALRTAPTKKPATSWSCASCGNSNWSNSNTCGSCSTPRASAPGKSAKASNRVCPNNHPIPTGAKFCAECGEAAPNRLCQNGHELAPTSKFCSECGAPPKAGARKSSPRKVSQ